MEDNNFPVTYLKELEIYDLPEKEFTRIVLRKLSYLQENTVKQINTETIKTSCSKEYNLWNKKNAVETTNNSLEKAVKRINELEDRILEIIHSKKCKRIKKRVKKKELR